MIRTVKGVGIVNKVEIDAFLELSCSFDDPADVGNLISGFSIKNRNGMDLTEAEDVKKRWQEYTEELYLQARLQQHMNHELPDVQAGFRKGRGARDQIADICWIIKKVREFQKDIYFCIIDYAKAFDCVDHNNLRQILKEMGIADHLTCLLRNLYAGQEATVKTGHGTRDCFQIGKGVLQGCILSPCLFNAGD